MHNTRASSFPLMGAAKRKGWAEMKRKNKSDRNSPSKALSKAPPKEKPIKMPSDSTREQIIERMLIEIASGKSLTTVCETILPISLWTMYQWIRADVKLAQEYARACEDRADQKNDRVSEIIDKVEQGELDPNAARVMIDAIKWQACHERPKKYGDRIGIEHSVDTNLADMMRQHLAERGEKKDG